MRTERYNIYNKVHSSLRTQLLDAGMKIHLADFGKQEKAKETFRLINKVIQSFQKYLEQDTEIYHSVATIAPYIVVMLEKVHAANHALTLSLSEKMGQYESVRTKGARTRIGAEIRNLFFEFTASVLQNINKEENVINEILWSNYSDEQLTSMEAAWIFTPDSIKAGYIIAGTADGALQTKGSWHSMVLKKPWQSLTERLKQFARHVIPVERWEQIRNQFTI